MSEPMLELHVPRRDEFPIRQAWLADPEFMHYNVGWDVEFPGYSRATGCIEWPEQQWDAFEERLNRPAAEQGYFYVLDTRIGEAVGHVHYTVEERIASIGFNVAPSRRGEGLGGAFLALLLERIRTDTSAAVVLNEFEDERVPARRVHEKAGFHPDPETNTTFGRPTRIWRLHLERNAPEPRLATTAPPLA